MNMILNPWPWYVAGPLIVLVMFLLLYFGKRFGVSSNFDTLCAMGGAGRFVDFFNFDWRKKAWSLLFLLGTVVGGFISVQWLTPDPTIAISPETVKDLSALGFSNIGSQYLPTEIFGTDTMWSLKGFLILIFGGLLVGFGSRYAGGCTSGHAIMGLSNFELPSLIAVIGFFIGGLTMTWLLFPFIF